MALDGPHHNVAFHQRLCAHPGARPAGTTCLPPCGLGEHFTPRSLAPGEEAMDRAQMAAAMHAHAGAARASVGRAGR